MHSKGICPPTAAVAWFQFEVDNWEEVSMFDPSTLRQIWRPKEVLSDG